MLIGAVASEFMIEPAEVPSFVGDVGGEFEPAVRNAHGEAEVEGASTFFFRGTDPGETGDVFGNGEGVRADGVNEFVGKGEIGEGI